MLCGDQGALGRAVGFDMALCTCAAAQALRPNQLAVFFRNNHFATLFFHGGALYSLVTDLGYLCEQVSYGAPSSCAVPCLCRTVAPCSPLSWLVMPEDLLCPVPADLKQNPMMRVLAPKLKCSNISVCAGGCLGEAGQHQWRHRFRLLHHAPSWQVPLTALQGTPPCMPFCPGQATNFHSQPVSLSALCGETMRSIQGFALAQHRCQVRWSLELCKSIMMRRGGGEG